RRQRRQRRKHRAKQRVREHPRRFCKAIRGGEIPHFSRRGEPFQQNHAQTNLQRREQRRQRERHRPPQQRNQPLKLPPQPYYIPFASFASLRFINLFFVLLVPLWLRKVFTIYPPRRP